MRLSLNQSPEIYTSIVQPGLRVTGKHHTRRLMVSIDLLIDADFIGEYTTALPITGKPEYFSS